MIDPFEYSFDKEGWRRLLLDLGVELRPGVTSEALYTNATIAKDGPTLYYCDARTGAFTVTLPAAEDMKNVTLVFVKTDSAANAITIKAFGNNQTINGSASNNALDAQYDAMALLCDGEEWVILYQFLN